MKRFWKTVTVDKGQGGWSVLLDGRAVNTPAKRKVAVPLREIAERIAAEWDAQEGEVKPLTMPMMRTAATCLDRVSPDLEAVRAAVAAYGETDLLCYRAEQPAALAVRQQEAWNPLLDWAAGALGAELAVATGVMHVAQPPGSVARLTGEVGRVGVWELTALADLTTISGSLVLGLAVLHQRLDAAGAWALSRIDEDWNVEQWGDDADAAALAARRKADFLHAGEVLDLLRG